MALFRRRRARRQDSDSDAPPLTRASLGVFRRLSTYLRPYRRWLVFAIITLFLGTGLGLVLPLVIRNLVDVVLGQNDMTQLNRLAIGLLLVFSLAPNDQSRPLGCGEKQEPKNALCVDRLPFLVDRDPARETTGEMDELGGGPGVQTQPVDDLELALDHSSSPSESPQFGSTPEVRWLSRQ